MDANAEILLLGRDILWVKKVCRVLNGPHNAPYAQKSDFGWMIVGDVCLGNVHKLNEVSALKRLENGCPTLFNPCDSHLMVKDDYSVRSNLKTVPESLKQITSVKATTEESRGEAVFCKGQTSSHLPLRTEPSLRLWRRNLSRMITTGS